MSQQTNLSTRLREQLLRSGWTATEDGIVRPLDADHELVVGIHPRHLAEPGRMFDDHSPGVGLIHHGVAGVMIDLMGGKELAGGPSTIYTAIGKQRKSIRYSDHKPSDSFENLWADFEATQEFVSGFRGRQGLTTALTGQQSFFNPRNYAWRTLLGIEVYFGWDAGSEEVLEAIRHQQFDPEPFAEFETELMRVLGRPAPPATNRWIGWVFDCPEIGLKISDPTTHQMRKLLAPAAYSDSQNHVFVLWSASNSDEILSCLNEGDEGEGYQFSFAMDGGSKLWIGPSLHLDDAVLTFERFASGGQNAVFSMHTWEEDKPHFPESSRAAPDKALATKRRWFRRRSK